MTFMIWASSQKSRIAAAALKNHVRWMMWENFCWRFQRRYAYVAENCRRKNADVACVHGNIWDLWTTWVKIFSWLFLRTGCLRHHDVWISLSQSPTWLPIWCGSCFPPILMWIHLWIEHESICVLFPKKMFYNVSVFQIMLVCKIAFWCAIRIPHGAVATHDFGFAAQSLFIFTWYDLVRAERLRIIATNFYLLNGVTCASFLATPALECFNNGKTFREIKYLTLISIAIIYFELEK